MLCLLLEDFKIDVQDVWFEKQKYEDAYNQFVITGSPSAGNSEVVSRISHLEKENNDLKNGQYRDASCIKLWDWWVNLTFLYSLSEHSTSVSYSFLNLYSYGGASSNRVCFRGSSGSR